LQLLGRVLAIDYRLAEIVLKTTMNNFEKNVEGRDVERLKLKCRNWKLTQILKTTMNLTLDFEKKG